MRHPRNFEQFSENNQIAIRCPRCGEPLRQDISPEARKLGWVAVLFDAVAGSFVCHYCGWIELREFYSETRAEIILISILMTLGAIALLLA